MEGEKQRVRGELFADHYSQARQFYRSQKPMEQTHIADAIVFELSKVQTPEIRERLVAHLPHIDQGLAKKVADGLGLKDMTKAHKPARKPIDDLSISDALSIQKNPPSSFKGRKLGILMTDGIDDELLDGLSASAKSVGATVELIAPKIGGITTAAGKTVPADQKIEGAPSVLYDAVAVLATPKGVAELKNNHAAKAFAADAFAHGKFIALGGDAFELFSAVGITEPDDGMNLLTNKSDGEGFIATCAALRYWDRMA